MGNEIANVKVFLIARESQQNFLSTFRAPPTLDPTDAIVVTLNNVFFLRWFCTFVVNFPLLLRGLHDSVQRVRVDAFLRLGAQGRELLAGESSVEDGVANGFLLPSQLIQLGVILAYFDRVAKLLVACVVAAVTVAIILAFALGPLVVGSGAVKKSINKKGVVKNAT